jgi:hypothetical protein
MIDADRVSLDAVIGLARIERVFYKPRHTNGSDSSDLTMGAAQ